MSQDRTGNSTSREQKCSSFYIQDTTYKNPFVFRKSHLSVVCLTERRRAGGVGGGEFWGSSCDFGRQQLHKDDFEFGEAMETISSFSSQCATLSNWLDLPRFPGSKLWSGFLWMLTQENAQKVLVPKCQGSSHCCGQLQVGAYIRERKWLTDTIKSLQINMVEVSFQMLYF